MKEVSDEVLQQHEEAAIEGLRALEQALDYTGSDPSIIEQGKRGAAACAAYVRLRVSQVKAGAKLVAKNVEQARRIASEIAD